jgi:DNA modification methylase
MLMRDQGLPQVVRRPRQWVPTKDHVDRLSRSARQAFENSASRIARPDVARCLSEIRTLRAVERACKLREGDRLVELIDGHGLRAIDLARELGDRPSDISEKYRTAKTFPPHLRPDGVPYNHLLMAARMLRKFPQLGFTAAGALAELQRSGLTQHRDVGRHFARLALAASHRFVLPLPADDSNDPLIGRTHHRRFQDLLDLFPDRSIQVLHLDPPYVYDRRGGYNCRSAHSLTCDNRDPTGAVQTVLDLLHHWLPKLATGGVVLLWQPWGPLRPEFQEAVRTGGWDVFGPVVWDKGRPQPGDLGSPYASQGEMLWVLYRRGDRPLNHDDSPRHSILRFNPVSYPGQTADRQEHGFEKPPDLLEFLVRKHSRPGDLIFDACGCTGSMSVAAIDCGRRWAYAESNAENYALGSRRIAVRLAEGTAAATAV